VSQKLGKHNAEAYRARNLLDASKALRDDIIERAEWDKDAGALVMAGQGVWRRFNDAIAQWEAGE
jgi:hypothetical protein